MLSMKRSRAALLVGAWVSVSYLAASLRAVIVSVAGYSGCSTVGCGRDTAVIFHDIFMVLCVVLQVCEFK